MLNSSSGTDVTTPHRGSSQKLAPSSTLSNPPARWLHHREKPRAKGIISRVSKKRDAWALRGSPFFTAPYTAKGRPIISASTGTCPVRRIR